ncbi:TRADD-N-associated membrane domain-containing protein [Streptomyces sp. NPDC054797]
MNVADLAVGTVGVITASAGLGVALRGINTNLRSQAREESRRLRTVTGAAAGSSSILYNGDTNGDTQPERPDPKSESPGPDPSWRTLAGEQRIDDDRFAELLIEYYGWGLTQARLSTAVSLICSAIGVLVLLGGVVLAIWRASSDGDAYAAMVTSLSGTVVAVVGHLAHRRADKAMEHMQKQTGALRVDMRRERETEASLLLQREVGDPMMRAHLQAALVLKLSGAQLPDLPMSLKAGEGVPAARRTSEPDLPQP